MKQDYDKFVEKFKPKLTTDDCYTPPLVYDAVRDWCVKEYNLNGQPIVRPFYPGGDYENFDYPDNCVVIDNPPFSIFTKICSFYADKGIDFFLFAPHMTLFSCLHASGCSAVVTGCTVTYENGATVKTSFATNLDTSLIRTAPDLKRAVEEAGRLGHVAAKTNPPRYVYPKNVVSSALLGKVAGIPLSFSSKDCYFIRELDSQKPRRKRIFGSGFLISDAKAAELRAAELKAAELKLKAAELKAAELKAAEEAWELSDGEKEIISNLG